MNLGIGYKHYYEFLHSLTYSYLALAAFFVLLLLPLIFYFINQKYEKPYLPFVVCALACFAVIKFLSLYLVMQNPDEGSLMGTVLVMKHGGVYWKDVDCVTLGPLNTLYLYLFKGGQISFTTCRIAAFTAQALSFLLLLYGCSKLMKFFPSCVIAVSTLYYYSFYFYDVIAYNSENLFELCFALWFFVYTRKNTRIFGSGLEFFVLGLFPFIKLQYAVFSFACFLFSVWKYRGRPIVKQIAYVSFALLPALFILLYVLKNGAFREFWLYYIEFNWNFVHSSFIEYCLGLPILLADVTQKPMFTAAVMAAAVAAGALIVGTVRLRYDGSGISKGRARLDIFNVLLLALFGLTLFAITRPRVGCVFDHYANTLLIGCTVFAALFLYHNCDHAKQIILSKVTWLLTGSVFFIHFFNGYAFAQNNLQWALKYLFFEPDAYPFAQVVAEMNKRLQPGEPVLYWGWEGGVPVYSGHPSAVAETHFIHIITPGLPEKFREKYVSDILERKPKLILDPVCPSSFNYRPEYELSNFPFMKEITDKYYEAPVVVPVGGNGSARLYFRKPGL